MGFWSSRKKSISIMSVAERLSGRSDKEYCNASIGLKLRYPADVKCEEVPMGMMVTMVTFVRGNSLVQLAAAPVAPNTDLDGAVEQCQLMARAQFEQGARVIPDITPPKNVTVFDQNIDGRAFTATAADTTVKFLLVQQNKFVFNFQRLAQTKSGLADADALWERIGKTVEFFEPEVPISPVTSVVWSEFVHPERNFSIRYPLDWNSVDLPEPNAQQTSNKIAEFTFSDREMELKFTIVEERLPLAVTLDEYWTLLQHQFRKSLLLVTEPTETKINQRRALQMVTSPQFNIEVFRRFTVYPGRALMMICECKNAAELKIAPLVDRMMDSFAEQQRLGQNQNLFELFSPPLYLNFSSDLKLNLEAGTLLYLEHPEIKGFNFEAQVLRDDPNFDMGLSVRNIDAVAGQIIQDTMAAGGTLICKQAVNPSYGSGRGQELVLSGKFPPLNEYAKKIVRIVPFADGTLLMLLTCPESEFSKLWTEYGFDLVNQFRTSL